MEEQLLYTKYALLTPSDYLRLNEALSERMGYTLGDATARLSPINPPLSITKTTVVDKATTYETACVLMLPVEVQEKCADLLTGFELVDNYTPYTEAQTELVATGLTTDQIDWTLNHLAATGVQVEIIQLESEPRSELSDNAVNKLVGQGITIITVDNG